MKTSRPLLIGLTILVVGGAIVWFSISQSSDSGSSSASDRSGMTMSDKGSSTANHAMGGAMTMGGSDSMQGMTPLVSGANGTKPSAGGLTLEPQHAIIGAGNPTRFELRVRDRGGMPVERFEKDQTKYMHLIVVRNDLTAYQHLHPQLGQGGVFTVQLRLPKPGTYRAIADFTTAGKRYALGVPIRVPGKARSTPVPAEAMNAEADGYQVMTMHSALKAGSEAQLDFTIERSGRAVTALLPYLGAYGHLVALRKPTLAYSHVHPTSEDRSKGMIGFSADFPRAGTYRLFLQFRTASGVHTAPFTVEVR